MILNSRIERRKPNGTSKRVLLVDDNPDITWSLKNLLEAYGHTVHTAHSAFKAIELACEFKPDIALLDLGLPDMTGYDLAVQLRALRDIRRFTLVAVTGYGRDLDKHAEILGFDRYFTKPLDSQKLGSIGLATDI